MLQIYICLLFMGNWSLNWSDHSYVVLKTTNWWWNIQKILAGIEYNM